MCQGLLTGVTRVSTGSQGACLQQCVRAEGVGVSPAEPGGPVWMRAEQALQSLSGRGLLGLRLAAAVHSLRPQDFPFDFPQVRHENRCVALERCPCFHQGREYAPGDRVKADCNTW